MRRDASQPRDRQRQLVEVPRGVAARGRASGCPAWCGRTSRAESSGVRPAPSRRPETDQYSRKSSLNRAGTGLSISVTRWPSSSSSAAVFSVSSAPPELASRDNRSAYTPRCAVALARPGYVTDGRQLRVAVPLVPFAVERRGVAHRAGQHPVGDELQRHLPHACSSRGSRPRGRFQPHQAVAGGRDPDRPAAVIGVRDRHHARGHERTGPRRRGAGGVLGFHGLRTGPSRGCSAEALKPNSDSCVLPSGTRPVDRNTRANSPSSAAGRGSQASVPSHRRHARDGDVVLDERRHPVEVAAVRAGRRARRRARSNAS